MAALLNWQQMRPHAKSQNPQPEDSNNNAEDPWRQIESCSSIRDNPVLRMRERERENLTMVVLPAGLHAPFVGAT